MLKLIFCNLAFTCSEFFPLQMYLNYLANYVPDTWNYEHGCSHCDDDVLDLSQLKVSSSNEVIFLLFAVLLSPFLKYCCGKFVLSHLPVDTGKDETEPGLPA